jgi:hypothetical protein
VRAIQTILPTALALGLKVKDPFERDDTDQLAREIVNTSAYDGKTVVIAWEHKVIIDLAESFGVKRSDQTDKWPGEVFDQAWVIRFADGPQLQIIPEFVLPGDNPRGGKHWQDGPSKSGKVPVLPPEIAAICENNDMLNDSIDDNVIPPLDDGILVRRQK